MAMVVLNGTPSPAAQLGLHDNHHHPETPSQNVRVCVTPGVHTTRMCVCKSRHSLSSFSLMASLSTASHKRQDGLYSDAVASQRQVLFDTQRARRMCLSAHLRSPLCTLALHERFWASCFWQVQYSTDAPTHSANMLKISAVCVAILSLSVPHGASAEDGLVLTAAFGGQVLEGYGCRANQLSGHVLLSWAGASAPTDGLERCLALCLDDDVPDSIPDTDEMGCCTFNGVECTR